MELDEQDLINRIVKIRNLREECFKYLEAKNSELLSHKVVYSIAKLSSERMGPVKLSEIAQDIFGASEKSKQDIIRLTVDKTLLRCGVLEKLHYAPNDVRYMLTAYRFQKVRKIESFRGDAAQTIGDVLELPRPTWPIPEDFLIIISRRNGYREAQKKLRSDFDSGRIQQGRYEDLEQSLAEKIDRLDDKIGSSYAQIVEIAKPG
jgi:hypothetical protein